MFLSEFSVKRPVAAVVVVIALMGLGLVALGKLRVNNIPDVQQPLIAVGIAYPGASPDAVEREIVDRIERTFQGIEGVDQARSHAKAVEGMATFTLVFDFHKDMAQAADDIRNAIGTVRHKLPAEMREPVLTRVDPSAQPVMQLALSSGAMSHAEISLLAEDKFADRLRAIPGVSTVNVNGARQRELSVLLHARALHEFGVTAADVVNALRMQNATAPVGKVRGELEDQSIRLAGRFESPAEFGQMPVKRRGDDLVRLGQVATVADGFADADSYNERDGRLNVGISVSRTREASTVGVAREVRRVVKEIDAEYAGRLKLEITEDGGDEAQDSLDNVVHALVFGAGLTIAVVYVFLNSWRSTLITGLSLPTSVVTAFIAVWLCGFTLNFMSLLGLSLAIGVLIDDAIVVRENIVRHLQRGEDRRTAALRGTAEIGPAVAATTFSIVSVFAPVAFIPGMTGEWFRPFGLTVVASVVVSLLVSFTLDPLLSAYWGDPGHPGDSRAAPRRGLGPALQRFNDWFDHQADRYGRVIGWALRHRWTMGWIAFLSLAAAIGLQAAFGGSDFLPKSDVGTIMVQIRMPPSASLEYARLKTEAAVGLARGLPEHVHSSAQIAAGQSSVFIDIGKSTQRKRSAAEVAADLRGRLGRLVGAEYTVADDLNNGGQKSVELRFYGADARRLQAIAADFMERLRRVPGAVDVELSQQDPQQELRIDLDRGLANRMGVSINDAAQTLRVAFAGVEAGDWVDPTGETRDVAVRLAPEDRVDAGDIERLPIGVAGTDRLVPLEQIATVSMGRAPSVIEHAGGKRMVTVGANAQGRSAGEVLGDAMKIAKGTAFPPGYGLELAGDSRDQQEVFGNLFIALISGVALMYLVLVIQFGSFTAPVPVMISLPLSLIGVVAALLATGGTLNLMSLIGVIMLMGLVAKNAILLLDAARAAERAGAGREEALMRAGRQRLRPILMTTFALIAGMLPVAIGMGEGGEFYRPMAVTIIGGTVTSTLLTLLVIPCFYDSIEGMGGHAREKFAVRAGRAGVVAAAALGALEFVAFLCGLRFAYRAIRHALGRPAGGLWRGRRADNAVPPSPDA
jgi:HAE1 family hydrophobic/amphiphilic exporter-1